MLSVMTDCQLKRGLFKCGAEAAGLCQYCGRTFCREHGIILEDGQEVCSRKFCVAKREDLARHLVYKAIAERRNEKGACGVDACGAAYAGQCIRCKALFCELHVGAREEIILENNVRLRRMATLCQHCWARRPIWLRT